MKDVFLLTLASELEERVYLKTGVTWGGLQRVRAFSHLEEWERMTTRLFRHLESSYPRVASRVIADFVQSPEGVERAAFQLLDALFELSDGEGESLVVNHLFANMVEEFFSVMIGEDPHAPLPVAHGQRDLTLN